MSGVVLRCPHCGTTQVTQGECQACHESSVRYFCSNHSPGHWLESPRCGSCGATFGERTASPSPKRKTPPLHSPARDTAARSMPPPSTSAEGESAGPWKSETPRRTGRRFTIPTIKREYGRRAGLSEDFTDEARTDIPLELPPPVVVFAGCLRMAVSIVLFFIFLFLILSFWIGGSLIHVFYF
jgi:hypothetical protein